MADETNLFDSLSGITVTSGFKAQIEKPLDQRDQVDTINDLHKLVDENGAWEGMKVYVKETKTTYELKGDTNDDWVATNEDIANDVVTPEKLDRKYIELKSVDSATDLDAVTSTGVYTVNTEVEDISSKHFPLSPDGNYWSDGTMIVTEQDNNESMQIFIHDGELDAGIAIRTVDATNQTNYKHDYTFLKPDGTNITGGYTAGRNAKVATYEGTALEFMFLGQYKNGKQLENTQGSPLGLYDKNLLTPSVNSGAQVLNIFDFGKEANIATVTLYVSDNGANTTNMVCLTNDISEGRANYKDILRTSGAIQNGVPILENKLATDGYIKVGYLDGSYIGKYRYIIVYDWSNTCTASELQVETDIVETPIPAIQIGDGTNNNPYTFQVYDYTLLNEDGKIPSERLPDSSNANITKNPQDETGDIISTHLTVGSRPNNDSELGDKSFTSGSNNKASGENSAVLGGEDNYAKSKDSVIIASYSNETNSSDNSLIISSNGSYINNSSYSIILNGWNYTMSNSRESLVFRSNSGVFNDSDYSIVIGSDNAEMRSSTHAMIINGDKHIITSADYSMIIGGYQNTITFNSDNPEYYQRYSSIISGYGGIINNGYLSMILSGNGNEIDNSQRSIIMQGYNNTIKNGSDSCIIVGSTNDITSNNNIIINSSSCSADGTYSTIISCVYTANHGDHSIILGGTGQIMYGQYSGILSGYSNTVNGDYSVILGGYGNTAEDFQIKGGHYCLDGESGSKDGTQGDAIGIGNGTSSNNASNCMTLSYEGHLHAPKTFATDSSCESYMFEWSDGNTSNADRRGLFVTLDGEKIEPATSTSEYILGVVCGQPAVVGDAYSHNWQGMYERDVFGDYKRDSDGNLIISALYDHTLGGNNYASRESRKEWASVGIIGKLVVTDDGTCQVNGYCKPKAGGIATAVPAGELSTVTYDSTSEAISINNTHKYRVLSRIDSTHIKILFR